MQPSDTKPRILIVDDEPSNIKILGDALADEYNISVATTGKDALIAAMSEPRVDLILLDIVMPEMHGYQVCERLKENIGTADIPVIFVTSLGEDSDETRGLDIGAADYITKPYNMAIIKSRIRVHIRLKQHEQFVASIRKSSDRDMDESRADVRALLRQLGNE